MMKFIRPLVKFKNSYLLALIAAISALPVVAQPANFGTMTLSPGFKPAQGTATGFTGGSYSLSTIANRDRNNSPCIGFGDTNPDHILVLDKGFERLKVQVDSKGNDTTLVIKGPKDSISCGDDTGSNKDASIESAKWRAGTYLIWVGAIDAGAKYKYTLSVQE
ncbi:hypothetical protein [Synechocystis sp. PCC 7509]|uniref:hypothetical protein n=1 Tax=Synechocystis sp. PCC 7509 TaxID=927677 RepID=UPI0002FCDF48|nr:hypothetical protein [Synechocystis sp. PCC 7509]